MFLESLQVGHEWWIGLPHSFPPPQRTAGGGGKRDKASGRTENMNVARGRGAAECQGKAYSTQEQYQNWILYCTKWENHVFAMTRPCLVLARFLESLPPVNDRNSIYIRSPGLVLPWKTSLTCIFCLRLVCPRFYSTHWEEWMESNLARLLPYLSWQKWKVKG